jgi:hypothetical protein
MTGPATADAVCAALTALLRSRTAWDEAPGLYLLYRDGGTVRTGRPVLPAAAWDERPPETLAFLAGALELLPGTALAAFCQAPGSFIGAVFRCESWCVSARRGTARMSEMAAMGQARKLHQHPERIEQRTAWAVTRDGASYVASQVRGRDEIDARRAGSASGLVPESLLRMTRALSAGVN